MTEKTPEEDLDDGFLADVRNFLEHSLNDELRAAGRATIGVHSDIGASREWHRCLDAQGWAAPAWPVRHGGTGWTARQRFLFARECARQDAPILSASGLRALGPLLIARGTPQQQARFLPPILRGDDLWCQGFSESGAGSDLAALSLAAHCDGDAYRLDGRKLWTTDAQHANRMFVLVRTSRGVKPHEGITFLLLDMDSPGLSVLPIATIDGEREFNEVVFDGVRVPAANRVGAEGEGWEVAKLLMRLARANNTTAAHLQRGLRRAREAMGDGVAATGLASIEIAIAGYEALELRLLSAGRLDGSDECAASMLKVLATELNQRICEFALAHASYGGFANRNLSSQRYFATRAASIYSGTNEIHRNLLARHLPGG